MPGWNKILQGEGNASDIWGICIFCEKKGRMVSTMVIASENDLVSMCRRCAENKKGGLPRSCGRSKRPRRRSYSNQ